MAKIEVEGFISTAAPVRKYGWVALAEQALPAIAEEFKQLEYMTIDHDSRERVPIRVLEAELRRTESGTIGVWVRYEVDEEDWRRAGDRMGFSITVIHPLVRPDPNSDKPIISIAFEAGRFDEQTASAVVESLRSRANVEPALLFQFGEHIELARVAIEFVVATLQSIGANGLYDALRHILARNVPSNSAPIVFDFRIREERSKSKITRTVSARLETNNSEDLRQALATLEGALQSGGDVLDYDPGQRTWKKLR